MGERTSNEMGNLSLQTKNRFPRDLLQRFMVGTTAGAGDPRGSDPEEDTGEEVELNLGLSLGGRFGVDKSNNKLVRSSSIAAILPVVRDDDVLGGNQGKTGPDGSYSSLIRTSSLPVETEEEWRKRKELQSLRRLAAKRRRSEKQRTVTRGEREEYVAAMGRVGSSAGPPLGSGNWVSGGAAKQSSFAGGSGVEGLLGKGIANTRVAAAAMGAGSGAGGGGGGGGGGFTQPSSQGSVESQASSVSEFESRHLQGSSSGGEASPVSMQTVQEQQTNPDPTGPSWSKPMDPTARPTRPESENPSRNRGKQAGLNTADMPCVFTQGDGPNGRRIEGILYKYGKGEEVKIMCVCHGSFLSPAEFVKHAGGTDVEHPLKHIVVNPNSSSYL